MMHHLVQIFTSWKAPMKMQSNLPFRKNKIEYDGVVPPHKLAKHRIWCSLNVNLQWPLGGNLGPTCFGFFSFISFSNNRGCPQIFHYRTLQNSLIITYALLFDSNFPLLRSIPTIYFKSVTSHQLLKRMVQCRTLPVYELLGDEVKISESWSCRFLRKGQRENDSSRKLISHDGNTWTLKGRKRQENAWKRYV